MFIKINLSFKSKNGINALSVFSQLEEKDIFGEYSRIFVKTFEYDNTPFLEDKDLLLRNRGLLFLEIADIFVLDSIDIYGIKVEKYLDSDADFPDEDTEINADIDLLMKINATTGQFIICYLILVKTILISSSND